MKTQSKIKAISQKENRYAVKLEDNNWYSAFGKCPEEIAKEDSVEIEYEKSGDFFNIKSIKKIEQFMGVKVEEKKAECSKIINTEKIKNASIAVSYAKDLICADKIKLAELNQYAFEIYGIIMKLAEK